MTKYRILLCDDDAPYANSLLPLAAFDNIEIKHCLTWEETQIELEQRFDQYDAVILDALGQRNTDSNRNDIGALTMAVRWLQKAEGQGHHIPYVINSAFVDTSVKTGFDDITHFDKTQKQEKALFKKLKEDIDRKPSFQLRRKYQNAFASFGGKYLPIGLEQKMLKVLSVMHGTTISQSDFNSLRDILEGIFKRANTISTVFMPNDLFKSDGRPNLEWCYRYLCGLPTDVKNATGTTINAYPARTSIVSSHIGRSLEYIKSNSSILSHAYAEPWTKYSYDSLALALLEVLVWFKQYVDKTYP